MNKKLVLLPILGITLSFAMSVGMISHAVYATEPVQPTYYVDFFDNYLREDFVLSNGTKGKGNNLIYKTVEAKEHGLLEKPEDPVRDRYEFQGWYLEEECKVAWDFANDRVGGNLRLFAKWVIAQQDAGQEPEYYPPVHFLDVGDSKNYELYSVMNFKINDGVVKLPTAAIMKLEAAAETNHGHVLDLMEYAIKPTVSSYDALYENGVITFKCYGETETINVKDNSTNLILDNSSYETKAKNYEAKIADENENYHVMLAGSSSIEFWTSSKEDLEPIVSYNHGIGGTTIEQWDEKLNQRLVFPYRPKMVVYYVGINNVINSKQSAETIWSNLEKFFNDTHEALPDTKVQYIMMNLIPGYKTYWDVINSVNAQVEQYQKANSWLTLINPGLALLKENGEPNAAYFRTDGLHLSYYGYVVWGEIIKQSIIEGLNKK